MKSKNNYHDDGKIYKLYSPTHTKFYIGSTIATLGTRLSQHKYDYKKYLDGKYHYVSSFEICKYKDVDIQLIEKYPCKSRKELEKREGEIISKYENDKNCVNLNDVGKFIS
jgi:hypothetical protein